MKRTHLEILESTEHRPWKLPAEPWKFYQEWNRAIFLHWEVKIELLKKYVPEELEIDLFNGQPWVSIVAFSMEKIRPRYFPEFSPISNFDEINIRTYVKLGDKTGVYFLSIEGGARLSCFVAKNISELPYRYSKMKRTEDRYTSQNAQFHDELDIKFNIGRAIKKSTPLDTWLTERYAVFQDTETAINKFEIHHLAWTMSEIDLQQMEVNYPRFEALLVGPPRKTQYSNGVQVLAWGKKKKDRNI